MNLKKSLEKMAGSNPKREILRKIGKLDNTLTPYCVMDEEVDTEEGQVTLKEALKDAESVREMVSLIDRATLKNGEHWQENTGTPDIRFYNQRNELVTLVKNEYNNSLKRKKNLKRISATFFAAATVAGAAYLGFENEVTNMDANLTDILNSQSSDQNIISTSKEVSETSKVLEGLKDLSTTGSSERAAEIAKKNLAEKDSLYTATWEKMREYKLYAETLLGSAIAFLAGGAANFAASFYGKEEENVDFSKVNSMDELEQRVNSYETAGEV